jgi:hypothetical protein
VALFPKPRVCRRRVVRQILPLRTTWEAGCVLICIVLRASAFRAIFCGNWHTQRIAYLRHQPSCLGSWIGLPCKPSFRHPEALEQISTSLDYSSERVSHSRNFVRGSRVDWWTQLEPVPRSLRPANLRRYLLGDPSPSRDPGRGHVSRPLDCRFARRKQRLRPDTGRPASTGSDRSEPASSPLSRWAVPHLSKLFALAKIGPKPRPALGAELFYAFDHSNSGRTEAGFRTG